ncbi:MAG: hypothetical protein K6T83_09485 [Alicyclobacillus sp.]|nr:hypothetical protein [Alicyclobacillus sp.]
MSEPRFDLRFHEDAYKEYERLDNSAAAIVDDFFEELEIRADEIGKDLTNKHSTKLHGCKEIKLRKAGIRIVFRVTNEIVDILRIVYILAIEKREDNVVFEVADKRLRRFKARTDVRKYLAQARRLEQVRAARRQRKDKPSGKN